MVYFFEGCALPLEILLGPNVQLVAFTVYASNFEYLNGDAPIFPAAVPYHAVGSFCKPFDELNLVGLDLPRMFRDQSL
jgi:hypothetical protein